MRKLLLDTLEAWDIYRMTERERRAMLLRHPNVPSWWNLFQTARLDQARAS